MHAAVDHVHHRHGQRRRVVAAEVAVERQPGLGRRGLRRRRARRRGSRSRRAGPCSASRRARSARGRGPPGRPRRGPRTASASSPLTFATACVDALAAPLRRAVAQLDRLVRRRSRRPTGRSRDRSAPDSSRTSTSTVGLPRESSTCRPCTSAILRHAFAPPLPGRSRRPARRAGASSSPRRRRRRARSAVSTRARKRFAAARSSSSGSTFSRRATFTSAKSTSPSSAATRGVGLRLRRRVRLPAARPAARAARRRGRRARRRGPGSRSRPPPPAAAPSARRAAPGRSFGHVVEDALAALLLDLEPLPALAHARRRSAASTSPKTCGWRATSFAWTPRAACLEVARAALLEEQREEVRLEEQVAELVEELRVVARERRVRDLVGLLDRVRHDRAARSARDPRGTRGAAARSAPGARRARRRATLPPAATVVVAFVVVDVAQGSGHGA